MSESENEPTTEEAPAASDGSLSDEDKTMAMLVHLLGAFTGFLGPLIIWLIKKDSSEFINQEGKESLNWQITLAIGVIGLSIVSFVIGFIPFLGLIVSCIIVLVVVAAIVTNMVLCIMGGLKAKEGTPYTYPFSLKLLP